MLRLGLQLAFSRMWFLLPDSAILIGNELVEMLDQSPQISGFRFFFCHGPIAILIDFRAMQAHSASLIRKHGGRLLRCTGVMNKAVTGRNTISLSSHSSPKKPMRLQGV
ncbi:hypothetical protein Q8A64_01410 [Oxalobacteraceae bacterium R-40]|uniref:Secreted protein n=1 Tax=Keguizhuia sedimenti TaxID=3064264 RepID=A0ABU1BJR2_9BURK|nr:hypothetical protein [Oxalobacteraceae bacterium R-40]